MGYVCPYPQQCQTIDPSLRRPYGFINFDNIFSSMFTVFQSSTEQGWSQTMYFTQDSTSDFALLYHVFLVFAVDLMLINMVLAILSDAFSNVRAVYISRIQESKRKSKVLSQTEDGNWSFK